MYTCFIIHNKTHVHNTAINYYIIVLFIVHIECMRRHIRYNAAHMCAMCVRYVCVCVGYDAYRSIAYIALYFGCIVSHVIKRTHVHVRTTSYIYRTSSRTMYASIVHVRTHNNMRCVRAYTWCVSHRTSNNRIIIIIIISIRRNNKHICVYACNTN